MGMWFLTTNFITAARVHVYFLPIQAFLGLHIGSALCIVGNGILIAHIVDIYIGSAIGFDLLFGNRSGGKAFLF